MTSSFCTSHTSFGCKENLGVPVFAGCDEYRHGREFSMSQLIIRYMLVFFRNVFPDSPPIYSYDEKLSHYNQRRSILNRTQEQIRRLL